MAAIGVHVDITPYTPVFRNFNLYAVRVTLAVRITANGFALSNDYIVLNL